MVVVVMPMRMRVGTVGTGFSLRSRAGELSMDLLARPAAQEVDCMVHDT